MTEQTKLGTNRGKVSDEVCGRRNEHANHGKECAQPKQAGRKKLESTACTGEKGHGARNRRGKKQRQSPGPPKGSIQEHRKKHKFSLVKRDGFSERKRPAVAIY